MNGETVISVQSRIGVAVVNWNSGTQLDSCVASLFSSSAASDVDVVVLDNASQDTSMNAVAVMPHVKKIYCTENFGFAVGCNLAAKDLKNEFILFLNPDACVYEHTLRDVLKFMDSPAGADVGICGVQLLDDDLKVARSCARLPTPASLFFQSLGVTKIPYFYRLGSRMGEWNHSDSSKVEQVIGAFFFVRRKLFDELKGFDEQFFVYFEEVDFSLRAKKMGWSSFYLATAQAFHSGGGTSNQVKAKRLFYSLRSRLLYAFKNFSKLGVVGVFLSTLVLEFFSRSIFSLSSRSLGGFKETWTGYKMLYRWLFQKQK